MTADHDGEDYSDRDKTICLRASRAVLTHPTRAEEIMLDARVHSELERLKSTLCTADKAMEYERIPTEVRDRVLHWLLFGAPPLHPDPDEAIDAAVRQYRDDKLQLRAAIDMPLTIPENLL